MTSEKTDSPPDRKIHRKLAAILCADVAGYSRMMSANEEETTRRMAEHRLIMDAMIEHYGGRIANTAGDSVLAEFASSVEAVRCALAVQEALFTKNEDYAEDRWLQFRIGINAGDVIQQGNDLLGDSINIAARLESIAEPGGICISGDVMGQIEGKLTLQCIPLGKQNLKNIGRPVPAFKIAGQDAETLIQPTPFRSAVSRTYPTALVTASVVVGLMFGLVWLFRESEKSRVEPPLVNASPPQNSEQNIQSASTRAILKRIVFGGNDYLLVGTSGIKWDEAETAAREMGGYLVAIGSKEENDFIVEMIRGEDRVWRRREEGNRWQRFGPWIGLVQRDKSVEPEFGWVWSNGDAVVYENWFEFQPDNYDGIEDFGRFREFSDMAGIKWDDGRLNYTAKGYIVEIEPD